MAATNDVTGDSLVSKGLSEQGKANFDAIFPPKKREQYVPPPLPSEEPEIEWMQFDTCTFD